MKWIDIDTMITTSAGNPASGGSGSSIDRQEQSECSHGPTESHLEVMKLQNNNTNNEIITHLHQDSDIHSMNVSIILSDIDGNHVDDHHTVINSDVSRSGISSREISSSHYYNDIQQYHHSLTRQNGHLSLVSDNIQPHHDDHNHTINDMIHPTTIPLDQDPHHFPSSLEYINVDHADNHFQESLGLFDWDINLEKDSSSPVFPLISSSPSSSNIHHSSSSITTNKKTTTMMTTIATDGLDCFEFNENAVSHMNEPIIEADYFFTYKNNTCNNTTNNHNHHHKSNTNKCAAVSYQSLSDHHDHPGKNNEQHGSNNKRHKKKVTAIKSTSWKETFVDLMFPKSKTKDGKNHNNKKKGSAVAPVASPPSIITTNYPETLLKNKRNSNSIVPTPSGGLASLPAPRMQDLSIADKKRVISAEEKLISLVSMLKRMRQRLKRKNSNSSGRGRSSSHCSDTPMDGIHGTLTQGTNIRTIAKNILDQSTEEKMVQLVKLLKIKRERDKIKGNKHTLIQNMIMTNTVRADCCIHDKQRNAVEATMAFLKHILLESPQSSSCSLQHCLLHLATPSCTLTSTSISYILAEAARKRRKKGLSARIPPLLSSTLSIQQHPGNGDEESVSKHDNVDELEEDIGGYEYHGIGQISACIRALRTAMIDLIPSTPTELANFAVNTRFTVDMPNDRLLHNPARNELSSSFVLRSEGRQPDNDEIVVCGLVKVLFVKDLGGKRFVSSCKLNFDPNSILKYCHGNE